MKKIIFLLVVITVMLSVIPSTLAATYELNVAANARSCPKVSCSVVARLAKGTVIEVSEIVQGDRYNGKTEWLKITTSGKTAYVHSSLATTSAGALPPVTTSNTGNSTTASTGNSTVSVVPAPTEAPVSQPPAQLVCGNCSSFSSCDQARACLAAGNGGLDRDNDGVPCESICPGG